MKNGVSHKSHLPCYFPFLFQRLPLRALPDSSRWWYGVVSDKLIRRHGRETKPKTKMCCTERKYVRKVEHEECPCASLSGQGLFLFYMFECFTFMYVHVPHVSVFRGVRRGHWGALDLELQMVVSGKQTRVLCKSSQLSQPPWAKPWAYRKFLKSPSWSLSYQRKALSDGHCMFFRIPLRGQLHEPQSQ